MNWSPAQSAVGIILMAAGIVWVLQGLDVAFAPRSFMTASRWWVLWGLVAIVGGGLVIWKAKKR